MKSFFRRLHAKSTGDNGIDKARQLKQDESQCNKEETKTELLFPQSTSSVEHQHDLTHVCVHVPPQGSPFSCGSFERNEKDCEIIEQFFQKFQSGSDGDIEAAVCAFTAAASRVPDAVAAVFDDEIAKFSSAETARSACTYNQTEVNYEESSVLRGPEFKLCNKTEAPAVAKKSSPRLELSKEITSAVSTCGLQLAIGFLAEGRRQGWSVLVTAVPAQCKPNWTVPQFDWFTGGVADSGRYLVRATITSIEKTNASNVKKLESASFNRGNFSCKHAKQQQQQQPRRQSNSRLLTLAKFSLNGQPIQFRANNFATPTKKLSLLANSASKDAQLLSVQTKASMQCAGRLIGLYCTASYVTTAVKQLDNICIQVYNIELWPITAEKLMRNLSLIGEAKDVSDISGETIQCLSIDKTEQSMYYYHGYQLSSAGNQQIRRLCNLSLPSLKPNRFLPLQEDVKSIKVGCKYLGIYYRDHRLTVLCKASRQPVFEFSARRLSGLFQLGDTFELDSQDRLVEATEERVRTLFYNGVIYRDFDCTGSLLELNKRHLIGRRDEFYEALQCQLATMRLLGKHEAQMHSNSCGITHQSAGKSSNPGKMKARLKINHKLLCKIEDYICNHHQQQQQQQQQQQLLQGDLCDIDANSSDGIPVLICSDAFWFESAVEHQATASVMSAKRAPTNHHH